MIDHNGVVYIIKSAARPFDEDTKAGAKDFAGFVSHVTHNSSPQDILASGSTAGMDLCHHLSFGDIENMVVDYLNGELNSWQFLVLVGALMRPSWSNLWCTKTAAIFAIQWAMSVGQRLDLVKKHFGSDKKATAKAANHLVKTLNNVIINLRYGHASTNRSIQKHVDARLHRGYGGDPFMLMSLLYGWALGRPVFAAETSALINDWGGRFRGGLPMIAGGGIKMSESDQIVTTTQKSKKAVMGSNRMPVLDYTRRVVPIPFLPLSLDSILLIIGAIVLWRILGPMLKSYMGL